MHYSYTLAQKASNYGIFCFYNRNHSFYKTILLRYNADNKSGADGAAV